MLLVACGSSPRAPGSAGCSAAVLPEGAVVSSGAGGGLTGDFASYVAFPDGHVDVTERTGAKTETRTVDVGKPRIDQLVSDIRATNVTDEEEGCYVPDEPEPDGTGGSLVFRDGNSARRWSYSSGGDPPDAVKEASNVAAAFLQEVREQK